MTRTQRRTWLWSFDSPPEQVWPLMADTARFNEAAGLPKHEIVEQPRPDGSVLYLGRMRVGPFGLEWREKPVNWVSGQWFEHRRDFNNGPLKLLCATLTLRPDGAGSIGEYKLEAAPKGILGWALLRLGFFRNTGRAFAKLAATAGDCARGARATAFDYEAPEPSEAVRRRLATMVKEIEASGHGHGLAERLADLVLTAQEVDLTQIRPLRLAREWDAEPRHVIELCLEATRAGLLNLRWDLLCPRCRIAKAVVGSLDSLPNGAHCGTCNIDYDRDFSRNVELSFQPAAAIRAITMGEYCLFGPMSTPHVRAHISLDPGESRLLDANLAPGPYRLRTLEPGPEFDLDWDGGGFPEVIAAEDAMRAGAAAEPGQIRMTNETGRALTVIIEERHWVRDALTADRVTALQAFRDLFSDQVLRPGDEVAIKRVALMFTDLRGSTALYSKVGDAGAYHLVRDHFAYLAEIVRARNGAVVKTIGDAIMASFSEAADALDAALAIQREVKQFNQAHPATPIVIKLGLHEGPSIAVTLNDRLDYFGSTVNKTARLEGLSHGGDIVMSSDMAADPDIGERLRGLVCTAEQANLKGFDAPVDFFRVQP